MHLIKALHPLDPLYYTVRVLGGLLVCSHVSAYINISGVLGHVLLLVSLRNDSKRINCLALLHNKSVLNKWNIIHKTYSPRTSYVGSVAGDKPQFHSVTETAARKSILQKDFSSDMKSGSSSTES